MQRHGLHIKCAVHCCRPWDERPFKSSLKISEHFIQLEDKRLQMEKRAATVAGPQNHHHPEKRHFLLFSSGQSEVFVSTWCYLLIRFLLLLHQPARQTPSQSEYQMRGNISFNQDSMVDELISSQSAAAGQNQNRQKPPLLTKTAEQTDVTSFTQGDAAGGN